MQRVGTVLLFLLIASAAWAQMVPGTFNAQPAQPTAVVAGPLLTPPEVSYGAGINGPVITLGQTAVVAAPTGANPAAYVPSTEMNNSYPGYVGGGSYVPMPTVVTVPTGAASLAPGEQQQVSRRRFDYIVAPRPENSLGGESETGGVGDTSLGQIAASLRKGPPPTQRKFTNDDVARINGMTNNNYRMPGSSTEQPANPQQQPQQQALPPHSSVNNAPLPPGAKPSPFSPHPVPQTPTSSTSAEADPN